VKTWNQLLILVIVGTLTIVGSLPLTAWGQQLQPYNQNSPREPASVGSSRGIEVEAAVQNSQPAFMVRVSVDRPDGIYEQGELMQVSVDSEQTGYLYLIYKQADGSNKVLFPNQYEKDNRIIGRRRITLPTENSGFRLRIAPPLGDELLIALVTLQPLSDAPFGGKSLTSSLVTDIDLDTLIQKGVKVELANKPSEWAEHCVHIKTVGVGERDAKPRTAQRLGLFIGISKYKYHPQIRNLRICHLDAQVMEKLMREHGRLDGGILLVDQQATREAIQEAFLELLRTSLPGDEIFIYFSGHGGKAAATRPGEPDGMDEFLVPHDGNPADIEGSMLLDDTIGRWVQAFDGRKVCVIMDACYSGGQAEGKGTPRETEKSVEKASENRVDDFLKTLNDRGHAEKEAGDWDWQPLTSPADFLGRQLSRIKDIGQNDAEMLFSSASDEISFERREGNLSVMTYFLVEKVLSSDSLTLDQAYQHIRVEVPKYMQRKFPGARQTPQLVPEHGGKNVNLR
jgi:hypothetical protein